MPLDKQSTLLLYLNKQQICMQEAGELRLKTYDYEELAKWITNKIYKDQCSLS